jgi:nitrogen fixation/metabolism regulation signal transduction histidine kinase
MYVAWDFAGDQEEAYNARRLVRKEASVERSLNYTLDRLPDSLRTEDIPNAFSDRICELADIHGMDIALYRPNGRLLTQSTLTDDTGASIQLPVDVLAELDESDERIQGGSEGGVVDVYWNVKDREGNALGIVGVRYEKRALEAGDFKAFWSQLAPLYIVLFLGGAILAAILSNGLVRHLRLIRDRMRELEPGVQQTPIEYDRSDAIGELVDQYNALLKQLQAAVEELAKREREGAWRMMAMQVAHEIKNPLTPIKLGAQQLERAWVDKREDFDERLRRYTRVVVEQIDILAEISQDFSMLAAVGLDKPEEVNWAQATKEVAALYQQSNPQIEWRTSIPDAPVVIEGSKAHLTRAMNNLIVNAIDAVANEPHPLIAIGLVVSPEGKAFLTVEDNGIGIPEDRQKEIFQPHFTSKEKGTGLGLFITDSIVRQLNGRITLRSFPGQGSVFGLEFFVK